LNYGSAFGYAIFCIYLFWLLFYRYDWEEIGHKNRQEIIEDN